MDPQLDEPDLRSYLGVVARRKWLVAAVVAVVLGVAVGMSALAPKQYEVTAQVQTTSTTDAVSWVLSEGRVASDADREAENQVAYLESTDLRFDVIDACPSDLPCNEVWNVSAEPIARSEDVNRVPSVVELTLVTSRPAGAATLLNIYANTYVEELRTNEQEEIISLLERLESHIAQLDSDIQAAEAEGDSATVGELQQQRASFGRMVFQLQFTTGFANGGGAMVLSTPSTPDSPVSPRWEWNLAIGLLFGLFLGIAVAFLRDYFDDSVKSKDMVERVTGVPVLGLIPKFDTGASELVAGNAPSAPAAEAFRSLRTSVKFLSVDREVRVVQVTSPSAGEGKTVVAANLATVFAQAGDRVVLVGADLRRPRVEEMLGVSLTPGLTGVLIGEVALPQAIRGVEGLPNLSLLPAGYPPPNPSELLSGERARRLVDVLAQTYDLVVLDSPPVLPVSDALVLAGMADTTLLVTSANRTSRRALDRAVEVLHQVGAPLFGSVLCSLAPGATYSAAYTNESYRYDEQAAARHKGGKKSSSRAVPVAAGSGAAGGARGGEADGNGTTETSLWQPSDGLTTRSEPRGSGSSSSVWPPDSPSRS
jgi:succinoglycan biosynthesis transport protein ExoP